MGKLPAIYFTRVPEVLGRTKIGEVFKFYGWRFIGLSKRIVTSSSGRKKLLGLTPKRRWRDRHRCWRFEGCKVLKECRFFTVRKNVPTVGGFLFVWICCILDENVWKKGLFPRILIFDDICLVWLVWFVWYVICYVEKQWQSICVVWCWYGSIYVRIDAAFRTESPLPEFLWVGRRSCHLTSPVAWKTAVWCSFLKLNPSKMDSL